MEQNNIINSSVLTYTECVNMYYQYLNTYI